MKRWISILTAVLCIASMAGCSERKPSTEDVEKAIRNGDMTLEDALEKGYVSEEWADRHFPDDSVPAMDKLEANRIGDFTTKTLSGEDFTREDLPQVFFFAFLDLTTDEGMKAQEQMLKAYEEVKEAGAELVLAVTKQDESTKAEAPFPMIVFNDSLKEAVGKNIEMITDKNTGSWCVERAFLSAWYSKIEAQTLTESAASFVEMLEGLENSEQTPPVEDVKPSEEEIPEITDNGPVVPLTDNSSSSQDDDVIPDDPGKPMEVKG